MSEPPDPRWCWYPLAAGLAGAVAFVATSTTDAAEGGTIPAVIFGAVAAATAASITFAIHRRIHHPARIWMLPLGYVVVYAFASILFFGYTSLTGGNLPYPSVADALYLGGYALLVAFLVLLVKHKARWNKGDLLDAAIVTLSLGTLQWVFVAGPAVDSAESYAAKGTSILYALFDLVLVALAAVMVISMRRSRSTVLLLGAVAAQLGADAWFVRSVTAGSYTYSNLINVVFLAVVSLLGAAALSDSTVMSHAATEGSGVIGRRVWFLRIAALVPLVAVIYTPGETAEIVGLATVWAILLVLVIQRVAGLMVDVDTHRRTAEQASRLASLVEASTEAMITCDLTGVVTFCNDAAVQLYGCDAASAVGRPLASIVSEATGGAINDLLSQAAGGRVIKEASGMHRTAGGGELRVSMTISRIEKGGEARLAVAIRDVSKRFEMEQALKHQALTDPLTGLANRTLFAEQLDRTIAKRARPDVRDVVALIDLDGFKAVNDSLGHDSGDRLLCAIAGSLTSALRPSDTLARLGGDEFGVIIEDLPAPRVGATAGRLLDAIGQPVPVTKAREVRPRASVGLYLLGAGDSHDSVLQKADVAMYAAKARGGGYALFDEHLYTETLDHHQIELELAGAAGRGELVLHYQPVIELATTRMVGLEALVRWNHPTRGLVPPGVFIPIAEHSILIEEIGEWVLHAALRQVSAWNHVRGAGRELTVGVNLSGHQLTQPDVASQVGRALADSGADPAWVTIEVTETALVDNIDSATAALADIKATGVDIALDDFGTGYSSLTYLRRLPVDILKLDRSFVEGIAAGEEEWSVVVAITNLATSLGKTTLAEGIELPAQLAHLRALDCKLGQGFLFARPVPVETFEAKYLHVDHITMTPQVKPVS